MIASTRGKIAFTNLFTTTTTATKAFDRNPACPHTNIISFFILLWKKNEKRKTTETNPIKRNRSNKTSHSSAFKGSLLSTLVLRKSNLKPNRNENILRGNRDVEIGWTEWEVETNLAILRLTFTWHVSNWKSTTQQSFTYLGNLTYWTNG